MNKSLVLGIESSCDETAVALVRGEREVLFSGVSSQMELHRKYGGVVPEVASRRHLEDLWPMVEEALKQSKMDFKDLTGLAVTSAPGLIGALLVGVSLAKGLSMRLKVPLAAVNHLEAHLFAVQLDGEPVEFPALGLVVSGGHTELYKVDHWGGYELLGETRDDAAGEAFDKVGKLLGLPYPGGPEVEKLAATHGGDPGRFPMTRMKGGGLDFSFSGLKTAVALAVRDEKPGTPGEKAALAAKFQKTVVDEIRVRVRSALMSHKPLTLMAGGGVVCNGPVRAMLQEEAESFKVKLRIPPRKYCGDNAAMVAGLGAFHLSQGRQVDLSATAVASPSGADPFSTTI